MDCAAFKCLVEDHFGPADTGLLGEFVSTVEGLVQGGRDLFTAVDDTAQEMRDLLLDLQHLREDFADADLDDDDDELQDAVRRMRCAPRRLLRGVRWRRRRQLLSRLRCADRRRARSRL